MPRWMLWAAIAALPLAIWASIKVPGQYIVPVVIALHQVGRLMWRKYPLPKMED